ncbi:unnamed protein product [Anisakis simplex]|uniref:Secreted protein n=1 Tax=Anisakis simplex TaxID=6269 RepID=A0A0M3JQR6_ANISI|nr:unnamed protein product [Anisakis simplex]
MKFTLVLLIVVAISSSSVFAIPAPDPSVFFSSFNNIGGLMSLASNNHNRNSGNGARFQGAVHKRGGRRRIRPVRPVVPFWLRRMARALREQQ